MCNISSATMCYVHKINPRPPLPVAYITKIIIGNQKTDLSNLHIGVEELTKCFFSTVHDIQETIFILVFFIDAGHLWCSWCQDIVDKNKNSLIWVHWNALANYILKLANSQIWRNQVPETGGVTWGRLTCGMKRIAANWEIRGGGGLSVIYLFLSISGMLSFRFFCFSQIT